MKTPKYLVSTDHKAGFNFKDIIKGLESKDVLQAMAEVTDLIEDEENLYIQRKNAATYQGGRAERYQRRHFLDIP